MKIDDDAKKVPGRVRVLTAERYRRVSPNAIPPVVAVEEARVRMEDGVVVPMPIFPFANTLKIDDEVAILNNDDIPVAVDDAIDESDKGEEVPIPTKPG